MPQLTALEVRARSRRRWSALVTVVVVVVASLAFLTVPRTVAAGDGDEAWRVRVVPLGLHLGPRIIVESGAAPDGSVTSRRVERPFRLDDTVVVPIGTGSSTETLILGPTPRDASSVRVTSEALGVGEARPVRVGGIRFHVMRLPGGVESAELVAISGRGAVLEVATVTGSGGPS
jgi:hypothetical protein